MMGRRKVIKGSMRGRDIEREFEELYLESYVRVYNYVRLRMGGDPVAEDVVSEAYLLAARSFHQFDPSRAKFSTWVIKIAINCMKTYWRRERPFVDIEKVPEGAFATIDEAQRADDRMLAMQLMECLTPEEAELVLMKYMQGKRNVEIADELGMNASTVATKLFNSIRKMRGAAE